LRYICSAKKTIKMKYTPLILVLFAAILGGCGLNPGGNGPLDLETDFRLESFPSYSIMVPNFMDPTDELGDETSFQFMNMFSECYLVMIEENIEEIEPLFVMESLADTTKLFVDHYTDFQIETITMEMTTSEVSEVKEIKIDGYDARLFDIQGAIQEVPEDIAYLVAVVHGPTNIYMISSWTLKSKRMVNFPHFEQSIRSFQILESAVTPNS